MCEFCTQHGEGKKWYLEMKNYSRELLHEELSAGQQETVRARSRLHWIARFFDNFGVPAATGVPKPFEQVHAAFAPVSELQRPPAGEDVILEDRQATHFGQVLPLEDAERVIDMVDSVTRIPCGCRFITTGKTDKRYCFGLGRDPKGLRRMFPQAASSLEVLNKEEAKRVIREYDQEGLIHTVWSGVTPFIIGLCNCDRGCLPCGSYIVQRGLPHFFQAEYVGRIDPDLCSGCKDCLKQCQFGAEFYSSALGKVYIDPTRCFGCGVGRAACPTDAIELMPRQEEPAAAHLWLKYA